MTTPPPPRLAATCLPIRQSRSNDPEILMVRRNQELSFGGMWTFPGGTVEADDGPVPSPLDEDTQRWEEPTLLTTMAAAAVREAIEETNLACLPSALAWYSHWIPPKIGPPKRFATWFFLAPEHHGEIVVDESENDRAEWVTAKDALERCAAGSFPLAIPTWVTLDDLCSASSIAALIDETITQGPKWYHTHTLGPVGPREDKHRAMCWPGDAGYDSGDPDAPGPRNRVITNERFAVVDRIRSD